MIQKNQVKIFPDIVRIPFNQKFHYNFIPNYCLVIIIIYIDQSSLRFLSTRYLFISGLSS